MDLKLTKRLGAIVDLCTKCDTIIDVGTDHGKVAISIANLGIAKEVIATDVRLGPLDSCKKNADLYLHNNDVSFKTICTDGLNDIDRNNVYGIVIAGMGYDTIINILHNIDEYKFKYLILSPHTKITDFIKFLDKKNIKIECIKTVFEDDKAYFIIKTKGNV